MINNKPFLGIIGGSGIYELNDIVDPEWISVKSLYGIPSDNILIGKINDVSIAFLPRHGRSHNLLPSDINYRANIDCLKSIGVTDIISLSAVGSLKENIKPGNFVIIDQFIDRTFARKKTFFDEGIVAHVSMAKPVSEQLSEIILEAAPQNINISMGGTYLAMEGPQFSTLAESQLYRSWNCDVIGMTNMPEAKLAREAEICYVSVAMVTDYDCWHTEHENVSVDAMIKVLNDNADNARSLVNSASSVIFSDHLSSECDCKFSLENAIITSPEVRDKELVKKLDAVAGRLLN